jgi:beta-xylosidase
MKDHTGKTPTEYRKDHRVKEQEIEDAITVEGKEDSGQIREKLRAYLKVDAGVFEDNIFFRKKSIVVEADAHKGTHYERPWEESVNLGFAHDIVKTDFRNQICLLQNEISFRYGRFQGLFGKSARISVWGGQEYNFVQIDRIIDFLYEVKLIPFVELSFKPDMIQGKHGEFVFNNSEEIQNFPLDEYEELVIKFLKHMGNRYGLQEISRWRFEMMMEPSGIRHNFEENDVESYIEQFVRIRKTIKDIAPAALVGGPGFNLTRSEDLDVMIRMLHNLEERGSLPDFFSFYAFSFSPMMAADDNIRNLLLWEKRETVERITWAKKFIQSFYPSIKLFFVTEWNMDFSCRNRLHDSLIKAPFILQNCIDAIGTVDVLCYWIALDISVEYSDSSAILFGGPGLLSRHGIRKPSFFVYHFLSRLGPVLLAKGEGYIITEKSENNYTAIIFNYKYISSQSRIRKDFHELSRNPSEFLEDRENLTVSLRIGNIKSGKYKVKHHILNTQSGSVYDTWKNLSAIDELNSTETAWLERTCIPAIRIDFLDGIGNIAMDCELEPNETRLLEISLILE